MICRSPHFHETFTQTAPRKVTLSPGNRLSGDTNEYELVEPLGSGAVGNVWSARVGAPQTVDMVAVKIMLPREDLLDGSKLVNVRERFRPGGGKTARYYGTPMSSAISTQVRFRRIRFWSWNWLMLPLGST